MNRNKRKNFPLNVKRTASFCSAIVACSSFGALVSGCSHSAQGTATVGSLANPSASRDTMPPASVPAVKVGTKFISDVAAGKLTAAKAEMWGVNGDPIGMITTRVKAHGAIADVSFYSFEQESEMAHLWGTIMFADKSSFDFEMGEELDTDNNAKGVVYIPGKWGVCWILDPHTGYNVPA